MKTQNFTLFIKVGGVSYSRFWEASFGSEPMDLGYRLPWKIERAEGEIRLSHKSGSVFPLPIEVLKEGTEIELKEPENDSGIPVSLVVKELPNYEPIFREPDAGPLAAGVQALAPRPVQCPQKRKNQSHAPHHQRSSHGTP